MTVIKLSLLLWLFSWINHFELNYKSVFRHNRPVFGYLAVLFCLVLLIAKGCCDLADASGTCCLRGGKLRRNSWRTPPSSTACTTAQDMWCNWRDARECCATLITVCQFLPPKPVHKWQTSHVLGWYFFLQTLILIHNFNTLPHIKCTLNFFLKWKSYFELGLKQFAYNWIRVSKVLRSGIKDSFRIIYGHFFFFFFLQTIIVSPFATF